MNDNSLEPYLQEFPKESRQAVEAMWDSLSPQLRQELLTLLPVLPGQPGQLRRLFNLSHQHLQMAFGDKHKVAIVGPANVGKSTLYNRLIASDQAPAEVSPVPGTTRANQAADAGPFTIIDTPGADAVGPVGANERELALAAAEDADFLIIMLDAVQGVKKTEQALFKQLEELYKPYVIVLNKMDLLNKREAEQVVRRAAENLGVSPEQIIPISAKEGDDLERVVTAVIKAEPGLVAALGQGLPAYRWQLAWRVISGAASTAGLIALTPLPFIDFIPLVGVQASMILGIARIYNYRITPARAREVLTVFGGGLIARTLFQELSKLGGPPGWVVAAAVAAGTTVAMGYSATLWFERGERLTREAAAQIAQTVTEHMIETLKSIGRNRPSRTQLSERIREVLDSSSLADNPESLERSAVEPTQASEETIVITEEDLADAG